MQWHSRPVNATSIPLYAVQRYVYQDWDSGMSGTGQSEVYVPDALQIVQEDYERYEHRRGLIGPLPLLTYSNWSEVVDALSEMSEDVIAVYTAEEARQEAIEKERRELESYVSGVCRRRGVNASDTLAVLDALQAEADGAAARSYGLMEDGLCATSYGFGGGVAAQEEWFDMRNECACDESKAYRAMDFLAEQTPLAYAQWEERRREEDEE